LLKFDDILDDLGSIQKLGDYKLFVDIEEPKKEEMKR